MTNEIPWGPNGLAVYERTYSRPKADGTKETWPETVERVARGNLALVYGDPENWDGMVRAEYEALYDHILNFKIIPAGRHLWATGVKGRQHLFNCWTSGWEGKFSDHFTFTFLRLMEGGGVGANYSSRHLTQFGIPRRGLDVHIVCDPGHDDYQTMLEAGLLSEEYTSDWEGAFEVEDSREGWAAALGDFLDTYMTDDEVKHSKRVYDVSYVRPSGSRLKTFGGTASGPAPFARMMHQVGVVMNGSHFAGGWTITPLEAMEIDHAIAECVVSGGNRRSARMAMVDWDDPFITEFLHCKSDPSKHWTTNISVSIDSRFLDLLPSDPKAQNVHDLVVRGMLKNGEPGYFNASKANEGELEPIYTTNPCGEVTLHPWEACCLGHVNLNAFAPTVKGGYADEGGMLVAHELMARFLVRATFADINDEKSLEVQTRNRRIGVGHLGVQDFLAKSGFKFSEVALDTRSYGYTWFRDRLEDAYHTVRSAARRAAFEYRIPEPVKVTTVAPTGSISKLPGVGGEGIHPVYARYYEQRIRFAKHDPDQARTIMRAREDGLTVEKDQYDPSGSTMVVVYPTKNRLVQQVEDMGYDPEIVEQADELSLDTMLAFQAMYQEHYVDNAISFTVNIPEGTYSVEKAGVVIAKHLPNLKGTTIMPDGTRPQAPFTRITEEEFNRAELALLDDGVDEECSNGACPIR